MSSDTSILRRVASTATDRRTFLAGTGAAGVALVAAGCGSSTTPAASGAGSSATASPSGGGDAAVAMTAASLEVLAVATYKAAGAAKLALTLEKVAADTYLAAGPTLQSKAAITLAGALQSVDQMHAAILYYVLGQYPVPDVFQKTDMAYTPSSSTAATPTPS